MNTCKYVLKVVDIRANTCYNKTMKGGNNENIRTCKVIKEKRLFLR